MRRSILLALLLVLAGCRTADIWRVTWLEAVAEPSRPDVYAKVFWFNRRWDVGDCSLGPGSHATFTGGVTHHIMTGLALSTTRDGARLYYGITVLAADGTTLAHYPTSDGGTVYVANIPPNVQIVIGPYVPIPPDVYDRAARVLIHATCHPGQPARTDADGRGIHRTGKMEP